MKRSDFLYHLVKPWPRWLWSLMGGVQTFGRHHVPPTGPFLLVSNHLSYIDPLLIQSVCPRVVHAMAKSSQFAVPVIGALMARCHSFPVRRYQIDPQAVRVTLRRLEAGEGVSIYMEGERSWDGRLQPPRLGTVRLLLKAGVPVVPCVILGSYNAWPRWSSAIRRQPIRVVFGEPLRFPRLDDRHARDRALAATTERLLATIQGLLDSGASA